MRVIIFLLLSFAHFMVLARSAKALLPGVRSNLDRSVTESSVASPSPDTTPLVDPTNRLRNNIRVENREQVRAMLEGAKLQACQSREEAIRTRQRSLVRLGSEQLKIMDGWVKKLTDFYEQRSLSIENYGSLLSSVNSARSNLAESLDRASFLTENFSCETDDPKGLYNQFRQRMQESKRYMFEYRKAIKDLLVAIRKAAVGMDRTIKPFGISPAVTPIVGE